MTYSEEEIQKFLNILQSYRDTFNNTYFISQDTIPLKPPEKVSCRNCNNTHFINHKVIDIVINVFIQLVIFLVIMK